MGNSRRFLLVLMLFCLLPRAVNGQQPLHWDATIDSAKAAASRSNRFVLVFFCASYCGYCHRLENELQNQPGAVSALEANFVPVKIDTQFYQNTASKYGITRLPTTVILAPTAQGEVLAVIPDYMPVDQFLSRLNKVFADARQRNAGAFAQIQASPPVGSPAAVAPPPVMGPANPVRPLQVADSTQPPVNVVRNPAQPVVPITNIIGPAPGVATPAVATAPPVAAVAAPAVATAPAAAAPNPIRDMAAGAGLAGRPLDPPKQAAGIKPASLLFALDGFCPVQLLEKDRWQPGQRAWGAIHRGRTYLFAGPDEQRRFLADPDRYAPVSSGNDVVLLLDQGRMVSGDRNHGLRFDGHVYLFADEATLARFQNNPQFYADRVLQTQRPPAQPSQTALAR